MFKRIFLSCLIIFGYSFVVVENNWAQSVFRVGAWCLHQPQPAPQAIYEQSPSVWRIKGGERDKLLNLGLNYFVACAYGQEAEDALVFMGDSLASAPAPKDFKSTLEYVPPGSSSYFPAGQPAEFYQIWRRSLRAELYTNPTSAWDDSVAAGYRAMYNRHLSRIDGVHSFVIAAEGCMSQWSKLPGLNFMADSTIIDSFFETGYVNVPFGCHDQTTYNMAKRLVRADHFMLSQYVLRDTTPYSGSAFQARLDLLVSGFRDVARGIRDSVSVAKPFPILQTQQSPADNLRLPTKEEILCQVNLALATGAKAICYYVYSTVTARGETGLLNAARDTTAQYNRVKDINTNYQGTGQSLANIGANFLNLTWKEDFSIHQNTAEPISSTYKLHDVTAKIPGGATDAETETYVEVGVLQSGATNHYMVVNRRCTSTETREITMTFQSTSANAYLVTDIFTGDQKRLLPANATTITYTFTLVPGQGKLLKLEDLGNWSGTISSNTTWSGTVCVNANATVTSAATLILASGANVIIAAGATLTV